MYHETINPETFPSLLAFSAFSLGLNAFANQRAPSNKQKKD